jgi:hypothetical protein
MANDTTIPIVKCLGMSAHRSEAKKACAYKGFHILVLSNSFLERADQNYASAPKKFQWATCPNILKV